MRKRKKERKKFKDTKVGIFLKDKFPAILDIADDYLPPLKILTTLLKSNVSEFEVEEIRRDINISNKVTDTLSTINLGETNIKELIELYKEDFRIPKTKWWLSKTVWASVSIVVLTILKSQGIDIPTEVIVVLGGLGLLSARFPNKKINKINE